MKAAVMGYGTIGSGVVEILMENRDQVAKAAGEEIEVKYILDLRDFPDSPVADRIVHDFKQIEEDEEIRLVVETMGGLNPAYPFVKACLMAGKHVATSNKALVAAYGTELLAIAREKNVNFFFEASVGGGIPIIRPLYRCLRGERIEEITGILNGTTNYILTKMEREGAAFEAVLREAQNLGYAERNPEADVEGHDTCRKIAILTAMATGRQVDFEEIYTEGITSITDTDFQYAKKMGTLIKLFGTSRTGDGRRRTPPLSGKRCVQRNSGKGEYGGRHHVLRKRRGKASHRQRGGGGPDRGGSEPGPQHSHRLEQRKAGDYAHGAEYIPLFPAAGGQPPE